MGQQELAQVTQAIEAETVRHDLACQAVPSEQRLHAVGYLNLHMVVLDLVVSDKIFEKCIKNLFLAL